MQTDRYYSHSGRFPPLSMAKALGAGLVVSVPMAFIYAYAIVYIPIVGIITFILTAGFAAVVGFVVGWLLKSGNVRNNAVTIATAAGIGVFALWASWVAWVYAILRRADAELGVLDLVFDPAGLWRLINLINEKGAWNLKGFTPTGALLWGLWALEAAIILGVAGAIVWESVNTPFCEDCERWCEEQKGIGVVGHTDEHDIVPRLEREDYAVLGEMSNPTDLAFTRIDLHQCPQCRATNTITAMAVTVKVDKDKHEMSEKTLMKYLRVATGDLAAVKDVLEQARLRTAAATGGAAEP